MGYCDGEVVISDCANGYGISGRSNRRNDVNLKSLTIGGIVKSAMAMQRRSGLNACEQVR